MRVRLPRGGRGCSSPGRWGRSQGQHGGVHGPICRRESRVRGGWGARGCRGPRGRCLTLGAALAVGLGHLPVHLAPLLVEALEHLAEILGLGALGAQLQVLAVELQRRARVLDAVVGLPLDLQVCGESSGQGGGWRGPWGETAPTPSPPTCGGLATDPGSTRRGSAGKSSSSSGCGTGRLCRSPGPWAPGKQRGSCCQRRGTRQGGAPALPQPPSPPRQDPRARPREGAQCCHHQVDDTEVLLQAVAHELDSHVNEEAQLQVGGFESGEVLGGDLGIQVSRFDPRVLGQVIHDLQRPGPVGVCPLPNSPASSRGRVLSLLWVPLHGGGPRPPCGAGEPHEARREPHEARQEPHTCSWVEM